MRNKEILLARAMIKKIDKFAESLIKARNEFQTEIDIESEEIEIDLRFLIPSELKVLNLLAHGYSIKEISEKLHVSRNTVTTHLSRIYEKFYLTSENPKELMTKQVKAVLIYLKEIGQLKDWVIKM